MKNDLIEVEKVSLAKEKYHNAWKKLDQAKHDLAIALTIHDMDLQEYREWEYREAREEYDQALDKYMRTFKEYDQACVNKKFKSVLARLWYKLWRR